MADPPFHIVLLNPEIPNNTGNIGRTAAATGCRLHIVRPIGFDMSEKTRRRAGLDYWHLVDCAEHESWESFLANQRPGRLWLYTTKADRPHWEADLRAGDYLLKKPFYASFFEAPGPAHVSPIERQRGPERTFFEKDPYHYAVADMEWMAFNAGLSCRYVGAWGHYSQKMLAFRPL